MTVIAYKNGIMACDSLWTDLDLKSTFKTKIRKLKNDLLVGGSGENDDRAIIKLLSEIKVKGELDVDNFPSVKKLQDINQNLTMIVVQKVSKKKSKIFIVNMSSQESGGEGNAVYEITQEYYAVGSGSHLALGAMAFGADAEEACRIACRYELYCAEPIHTIKV